MDQSLARLVHRNLMDVTAWGAEGAGGTVLAEDGERLIASSSTFPFLNAVMREGSNGDAADLLERARKFFFARERGFVAYTRPGDPELEEAALAAGMSPVLERCPEMICHAPLAGPAGDLRAVVDLAGAAAYWRICDEAYPSIGFPPGLFTDTFAPQLLLEEDRVWACVAYENEQPVACASLWMTAGAGSEVGFIGWVAALPQARGRGLAAACTALATNRGFELGADVVSLQASLPGEPVYRRLGYQELFAYRLLGAMPQA